MKYSIKEPFTKLANATKRGTAACRGAYRAIKLRHLQRARAKHRTKLTPPYTHCKNCGHELRGMYCHACGQFARDINPNIFTFVWQYCENAFQFDGKFWLTVRRLFACPGRLSTEFMEGHIKRYVFPLKLYMMVAVVFSFIVLGVRKANKEVDAEKSKTEQTSKTPKVAANLSTDSTVVAGMLQRIDADSTLTPKEKITKKQEVEKAHKVDWGASGINFATRFPIAMMFAMPLFALFSRGFFRRRYRKYLPHLIFSIHIHTVFFIVLSLILIIDTMGDGRFFAGTIVLMLLWVVWYGYMSAIRFFRDTWWKVLFKNFFLYLVYYIFCAFIIAFTFMFNLCYDSWAAGNGFLEPLNTSF